MLHRPIPYDVNVMGVTFQIQNHLVYPPGILTEFFVKTLLEKNLIADHTVADVAAGSFALGILAAKAGARSVIGIDISPDAVEFASVNIARNKLGDIATIVQGSGLTPLLPKYAGKVDLVLSGAPWDSISEMEFAKIPIDKKPLTRAFYDVGDFLITDILLNAPQLLTPSGRIFVTSAMSVIKRLESHCDKHQRGYRIINEADLHDDGNLQYIVEILIS